VAADRERCGGGRRRRVHHVDGVGPGRDAEVVQEHAVRAHGTRDTVYSASGSRNQLLPELRQAGYDVTYFEFDGPHFITPPVARAALKWLTGASKEDVS